MTKKEKAYKILNRIEPLFPNARSELINWQADYQFLICIILSAQTTDAQVNKVTFKLFKKYPTLRQLAGAKYEDIAEIVKGINYYRNKSKFIVEACRKLIDQFEGRVPKSVKELESLPGVGYKTANVFLNDFYKQNEGIGSDTHIMRVSQRMGLSKHKEPLKVSGDLEKLYDRKDWHRVNTLFVLYGRYYCKARIAKNSDCILKEYCSYCKDR